MVLNRRYVFDLHNENIIFCETYDDWVVIDGHNVHQSKRCNYLKFFTQDSAWAFNFKITDVELRNKIKDLIIDKIIEKVGSQI